jgi:DNA-binding MarR family transcriptional regulator
MTAQDYPRQFAGLIRQIIRMKHHFRAVMPEHAFRAHARLQAMLPDPNPMDHADYDLLYRVGTLIGEGDGPLTMGELASAAEVPLSTATRLVDTLVESGFAERLSDPADRRVVRVQFSEAGAELYRALDELIQLRIATILRSFSDDECDTMLRLIRKMVVALEDESA